jgi:hypothetical protein
MEVLLFPAFIFVLCALLIGLYYLAEWHLRRPAWETVKSFAVVLAIIAGLAWLLMPGVQ